jgi:hypothetical protein
MYTVSVVSVYYRLALQGNMYLFSYDSVKLLHHHYLSLGVWFDVP